jgi:hypothetical protein
MAYDATASTIQPARQRSLWAGVRTRIMRDRFKVASVCDRNLHRLTPYLLQSKRKENLGRR